MTEKPADPIGTDEAKKLSTEALLAALQIRAHGFEDRDAIAAFALRHVPAADAGVLAEELKRRLELPRIEKRVGCYTSREKPVDREEAEDAFAKHLARFPVPDSLERLLQLAARVAYDLDGEAIAELRHVLALAGIFDRFALQAAAGDLFLCDRGEGAARIRVAPGITR